MQRATTVAFLFSPTRSWAAGAACRVRLALDVRGDVREAEVTSTSRWLAPQQMAEKAPRVCDQERAEVLSRISQTIVPQTP